MKISAFPIIRGTFYPYQGAILLTYRIAMPQGQLLLRLSSYHVSSSHTFSYYATAYNVQSVWPHFEQTQKGWNRVAAMKISKLECTNDSFNT